MKATRIALSLLLAGCANANLYKDAAIDATKQAKDIEADVYFSAPCAAGLGALAREDDNRRVIAVMDLCFPDWRMLLGGG